MPTLYVVPTPIGNLGDITIRALEVLRSVPLILAEDTRHTAKLLRHYDIHTRLLSYHQHNERARLSSVVAHLEHQDAALVSDAGMPAVSDPGSELIRAAGEHGVEVDVLPGPSAVLTAVVAAALPAPGFVFAGFLPRKASEREARLAELEPLEYDLVVYEAPHRLVVTLRDMLRILGDRQMAAARELTKMHQEIVRGSVRELLARYDAEEPRGEFTLVVAGGAGSEIDRSAEARDELAACRRTGSDARRAVSQVAEKYGIARNEAYRLWLQTAAPSDELRAR